jgi:translation initiation factor 1A
MPNFKGGKKYKSTKHAEGSAEFHEIGDGQIIGRIIKNLGNRNLMVYCNDNVERMAHIRGGLRKKTALLEVGDIVLISLRNDGMRIGSDSAAEDRGDILAKYEREVYSILKKTEGVNKKLFTHLEKMDERNRAVAYKEGDDDFGFTFEDVSNSDDESNEEDETGLSKEEIAKLRVARAAARDKKRAEARVKKETGDAGRERGGSDVDIDAI